MRRVYALGFAFLDVAFGQAGAAIPGCVSDCLSSTTAGCDSGDVTCLCLAFRRKGFIEELSSCMKKGCKADEVVPAEDLYGPLCAKVGNAPAGGAGQGESILESSTTAKDVTEDIVSIEADTSTEEVMSTDDTVTSTSYDSVKAGVITAAISTLTGRSTSESPAQTATETSEISSLSTEEEATETAQSPAVYYFSGGLSAGAKAGIGVGVAFGVIGLGCLVAAIWLIKRKRAATGVSELDVRHGQSVKSPHPFSQQVEVAEIDGRPAPQELQA